MEHIEQGMESVVLQQQAHTLEPLKHTAMDDYPVFNGYPYLTVYRVEDLWTDICKNEYELKTKNWLLFK